MNGGPHPDTGRFAEDAAPPRFSPDGSNLRSVGLSTASAFRNVPSAFQESMLPAVGAEQPGMRTISTNGGEVRVDPHVTLDPPIIEVQADLSQQPSPVFGTSREKSPRVVVPPSSDLDKTLRMSGSADGYSEHPTSPPSCNSADATMGSDSGAIDVGYSRNSKVAKLRLSDHGSHEILTSGRSGSESEGDDFSNILRSMTKSLAMTYEKLGRNLLDAAPVEGDDQNCSSPDKLKKRLSPFNSVDSEVALPYPGGGGEGTLGKEILPQPSPRRAGRSAEGGHITLGGSSTTSLTNSTHSSAERNQPKGLLHMALQEREDGGNDAVETAKSAQASSNTTSVLSGPKEDGTEKKKGKCLTNPSVPKANNNLDNAEGNLIVRVGDIFRVPNRNIQVHTRRVGKKRADNDKRDGSAQDGDSSDDDNVVDVEDESVTEYKVVDLLGQGTFAQVFKCRIDSTGEMVAVKIIKNKPAYTRQAAVEIDVFRALSKQCADGEAKSVVGLLCYYMYRDHLCLVFELLGSNLYEVLKKRQFCGLPLGAVQNLVQQAIAGVKELKSRNIVHCDLKPENILLVEEAVSTVPANVVKTNDENANENTHATPKEGLKKESQDAQPSGSAGTESGTKEFCINEKMKLIDFGSACFEGQSAHQYIQSRFYRSPEVILGLEYDSAIDMWSLGCVAAELFLGLPILPGVHEHDQLGRIIEMIGDLPDWMLDQGSKVGKYFVKYIPPPTAHMGIVRNAGSDASPAPPPRPAWRQKTRAEYIKSLSADEKKKRGGVAKLEQQPTSRYFRRKELGDIVELHGNCSSSEDKEKLKLFVHFLMGILDPDPWKRWTADQASMHPFISTKAVYRKSEEVAVKNPKGVASSKAKKSDIIWNPPWDPSICKRKLLAVQKTREKQQSLLRTGRRSSINDRYLSSQNINSASVHNQHPSPGFAATNRMTAMTDAMSLSQSMQSNPGIYQTQSIGSSNDLISAPATLGEQQGQLPMGLGNATFARSGSLGTALGAGNYDISTGMLVDSAARPHLDANATDFSRMAMFQAGGGSTATGYNLQQNIPHPSGAQSFSGIYHDINHAPIEGDLGYALHRPGVVPGMGNDQLSAAALQQQMTPLQYLAQQQQLAASQQASGISRSASSHNISLTRLHSSGSARGTSFQARPSSYSSNFASTPQSPRHQLHAPINQLDSPMWGGVRVGQPSAGASGSAPATSLLAQQLAEHSAIAAGGGSVNAELSPRLQLQQQQLMHASMSMGGSVPENDLLMHGSIPMGGSVPENDLLQDQMGSLGTSGSVSNFQGAGYYLSANGTPMMLSPPRSSVDTNVANAHPYNANLHLQQQMQMQIDMQLQMQMQQQAASYEAMATQRDIRGARASGHHPPPAPGSYQKRL